MSILRRNGFGVSEIKRKVSFGLLKFHLQGAWLETGIIKITHDWIRDEWLRLYERFESVRIQGKMPERSQSQKWTSCKVGWDAQTKPVDAGTVGFGAESACTS
jgi:hypothetical protein